MEVFPGPLPDGRRSGGDEGLGSRPPYHLYNFFGVCHVAMTTMADLFTLTTVSQVTSIKAG